ncbi:MAG: hypothetical protein D6E12_00775 [Desulfovibrio sp.]|nr:MAG: hypothetical protein D6E12_00775 [Desulfovibrio sp.]
MQAIAILVFILAALLSSPALALMPPHITDSTPEHGGTLTTDIITLEGYSLFSPESGRLTIVDLTTGQDAAWEIKDLTCEDEGDWERAETEDGAIQFRCELLIRLLQPEPGHEYELWFLDTGVRFTYAPDQ